MRALCRGVQCPLQLVCAFYVVVFLWQTWLLWGKDAETHSHKHNRHWLTLFHTTVSCDRAFWLEKRCSVSAEIQCNVRLTGLIMNTNLTAAASKPEMGCATGESDWDNRSRCMTLTWIVHHLHVGVWSPEDVTIDHSSKRRVAKSLFQTEVSATNVFTSARPQGVTLKMKRKQCRWQSF